VIAIPTTSQKWKKNDNGVFRKIRKTHHHNLEFGPKLDEIQKKTCKKKH